MLEWLRQWLAQSGEEAIKGMMAELKQKTVLVNKGNHTELLQKDVKGNKLRPRVNSQRNLLKASFVWEINKYNVLEVRALFYARLRCVSARAY